MQNSRPLKEGKIMAVDGRVYWGLSEILQSGKASRIKVHGEKNGDVFNRFQSETKTIFPPNGRVFCPMPVDSYCSFQVELNSNKIENGDDYIIKPDSLKPLMRYRLMRKPDLPYQSLSLEELQKIGANKQDGIYYIHIMNTKELIGPFIKDPRGFLPKTGKEAKIYDASSGLDDLLLDNNSFTFLNSPDIYFNVKSEIDCMSGSQLQEWFGNKLKEVRGFSAEKENAVKIMIKMLKEKSFLSANDLDTVRFNRVFDGLDQYLFSYEELKDLFLNDGFDKIVKKVEEMRVEIKQECESQFRMEMGQLNEERAALEKERDGIIAGINEMKSAKETIEKEIGLLTENRELLALQFKLAAQIEPSGNKGNNRNIKPAGYEIPKEGKSFADIKNADDAGEELELYDYLISKNLSRAGYGGELIGLYKDNENALLKAQALFIPCISWAYIFAQSIGNAKVYPLHVEHDWLHYRDFCDNGLLSIWNKAAEEKDTNYVLVLEDLNITQPECGCTPVLDVINGYRPVLEGTNFGLPDNLKIFATLLPFDGENTGLKLSKRLFFNWGQFGDFTKRKFMPPVKNAEFHPFGYFEPGDLIALYNAGSNPGEPYFDD
jgi:hypothetical protein